VGIPISSAGPGAAEPLADLREQVHGHEMPARDLISAISEKREPVCGLEEAAETVEMISAVFESHRQNREVSLPLQSRVHPLSLL
jgi:predicted dehydrogenase